MKHLSVDKVVGLILGSAVSTSWAFSTLHSVDWMRHKSSLLRLSNDANGDTMTTDALICGGGPAGLLTAIMLAQKFPNFQIQLYDRQSAPPSPTDEQVWGDTSKHYLIGLGGRGISSLEAFGAWADVSKVAIPVPGRKDWTPETPDGVERMLTERKYTTQVLPRDKLVSVLHQHIQQNYSDRIDLHYEYDVRPVDFHAQGGDRVVVEIAKCAAGTSENWKPVSASLVVASDGSSRTFADRMQEEDRDGMAENPFTVVRYEDDNRRIFKKIPFRLPNDWRSDLNYSVRSEGGRVLFDALPANDRGDYVGILLLRGDDEMAQADVDPLKFRDFLDEVVPRFNSMFENETIVAVAKSPSSSLPLFRFVTPRMHQGKRTVLLGDCAHTLKPYFGMGANSALEDVKLFGESIDSTTDLTDAILEFSNIRTPDIATLVRVSHGLDRPGIAGVFNFLIPIILDGIFQKLAPEMFAPNVISMIQKEEITFQQAVQRKRLDRLGQLCLLGSALVVVVTGTQLLLKQICG